MFKYLKIKKHLTPMLTFLLCFSFVFSSFSLNTYAMTQQELETQIDIIDAQIAEQNKIIEELQKEKETKMEYMAALEAQIESIEEKGTALRNQHNLINAEIEKLDKEIKQLEIDTKNLTTVISETKKEIDIKTKELEKSKDDISELLKKDFMTKKQNPVEILMGSKSLAVFLTRMEMMKRATETTKETIVNFRNQIDELNTTKETLETQENELNSKKAKIVKSKESLIKKKDELAKKQNEYKTLTAELETKYTEIETYIASLDQSSESYQAYVNQLEDERANADAAINQIINQSGSTGSSPTYESNDTWAWPTGDIDYYISSDFGYRESILGTDPYHGGIDITGNGFYGTSIYATRAGTVIASEYNNYGYGYWVLIDHGDGFISLYAHNSYLIVSEGDTVKKGQLIAYGGSSGLSTGPHLHFEIRYNGTQLDPWNYVTGP